MAGEDVPPDRGYKAAPAIQLNGVAIAAIDEEMRVQEQSSEAEVSDKEVQSDLSGEATTLDPSTSLAGPTVDARGAISSKQHVVGTGDSSVIPDQYAAAESDNVASLPDTSHPTRCPQLAAPALDPADFETWLSQNRDTATLREVGAKMEVYGRDSAWCSLLEAVGWHQTSLLVKACLAV